MNERAAIMASWLEQPDTAATYNGHDEPIVIKGNRAVTNGKSRYFEQDNSALRAEWDTIFALRFDDEGAAGSTVNGIWSGQDQG